MANGVGTVLSLDSSVGRPPLVLLVDPVVASRHLVWRALNRAFGVLEAGSARAAREWIARRPDLDALVLQDDLPDQRGVELVRELANARHPVTSRSIVIARPDTDWTRLAQAGATRVELGDLRGVLSKLAAWFLSRDSGLAKALLREAERLSA